MSSPPTSPTHHASGPADHNSRLDLVVDMVRELSLQTDPQALVGVFRKRVRDLYGGDVSISLSRRDMQPPWFRITRSTEWKEDINPWEQPERLPVLSGGLLADLLYADKPQILHDISIAPSDPAHAYLPGVRSLVALPLFENGMAVNMVLRGSRDPFFWDPKKLPDVVLESNLFGRATHHLVLAQKLARAYADIEHEMNRVAELQRALLPSKLPKIPGVDVAASYQTAARAGGDYYDFFDLNDGRWGVLIADVSGHGVSAAVVMAMLRTMLHSPVAPLDSPARALDFANKSLSDGTTSHHQSFATAFYGIYDPSQTAFRYASAGHHPALRVTGDQKVHELDEAQSLPLGIERNVDFCENEVRLRARDTLILYTDGIVEAVNPAGEPYGRPRLLSCVRDDVPNAQHIVDCVTSKLLGFTQGRPQQDDQTLLAMRVAKAD